MKALGIRKAVIITDGDVNFHDRDKTLEDVEGLEIKILYVGPGPKPGFLDELARKAGGYCDETDLKSEHQSELTGTIQKLLGQGSGSIQL
jgi:hypothetical protein